MKEMWKSVYICQLCLRIEWQVFFTHSVVANNIIANANHFSRQISTTEYSTTQKLVADVSAAITSKKLMK